MVAVNVVVLAGTVAVDPLEKELPSGDRVTEIKLSVPETGRRSLPLPVSARHGKAITRRQLGLIGKGDDLLVHGQLVRRFYRNGAGARTVMEVVATGIKKLEREETE